MTDINSIGMATLDGMRTRLLVFASVPEEALADIGQILREHVVAAVEAGTDPYDRPWTPKKPRAERGWSPEFRFVAESDIAVKRSGKRKVEVILSRRVPVLHHYGYAAGNIRRGVLPTKRIPRAALAKIKAAVERRMADAAEAKGGARAA